MRIAAIYNVWDGAELLSGSIRQIIDHISKLIIVYQDVSNFGEAHDPIPDIDRNTISDAKVHFIHYKPMWNDGGQNERAKRNLGIQKALELGCTHFLHMDCDEYYAEFDIAKKLFIASGARGSVCRLHTYFKKPTLRLDKPEDYYVPFIHELRPDTQAGVKEYPFYVDPTRRINEKNVVELPVFMHHYSWVRKDIGRKVRNSTARDNLKRKSYIAEYNKDLKEGDYLTCYERTLIEVPDYFNINSIL